jgi:UDP-glucose 6-dehydrogenase
MVLRSDVPDRYLECNENFRGFGGACLPKDTRAFAQFVRDLGLDLELFETIVRENEKFRTTAFEGMRN